MNWTNIIYNSELVYSSVIEDKMYRNWSLKRTTCKVSFYEIYPIDSIDKIICDIILSNGGEIHENDIATILGFNVIDNFDVTPKRYKDEAELNIFKSIIGYVIDWGLVIKKNSTYYITDLGKRAIKLGLKYKFFSGEKLLFENFGISSQDITDSNLFPYYQALGIYSEITKIHQIDNKKVNIEEVFDVVDNDLIERCKLQSREEYYIYNVELTTKFKIEASDVDFRLYKQNKVYIPIIFYNDQVSVKATELLYKTENVGLKEMKIEWGLYLKLIKDPNANLDYETIIQFEDLLDLNSLVKDDRIVWHDEKLFLFIAERADANQWHSISNYCSIEVIKSYIGQYQERWDWGSLSLRIDDQFLIDNAAAFPWNFEVLSAKENISIDIVKRLLLIPELKEQEWDWDSIMPQLEIDFIRDNINCINFELSELTKQNNLDIQKLITKYPDKKWDWIYISSEYELNFILKNIITFKPFLDFRNIIKRAFTSKEYVKLFCESINFKDALAELRDSKLRSYSSDRENYAWNFQLIDFLESIDYLKWESGVYTAGFECNPYINWDYRFFKKYHSKITTEKGFSFISKQNKDIKLVIDFPNFNWDWNAISSNVNLINNREFVLNVSENLNFSLLLRYIETDILEALFEKKEIFNFLELNPEYWKYATEKATIDFVRQNLDYNWDWAILTKRFCSSIKVKALGNPRWIAKWDWDYLTKNLDINKVYENLDLYLDYWNWDYLTIEFDKNFVISNLPEYNDYWDWHKLLSNRLERSELIAFDFLLEVATCISVLDETLKENLWSIITRKLEYSAVEFLINKANSCGYKDLFKWDYSHFYGLKEFNLRNYIDKYRDCVNWEEISCCEKLNNELFFDKNFFSYKTWKNDVFRILSNTNYHWNFKKLSKISNINWCDDVLKKYIELWDWEYLSKFSTCFKSNEQIRKQIDRISKFKDYIDFSQFSERNDNSISEKLIQKFIEQEWNWQALSQNTTIQYTSKFLCDFQNKSWDWSALSNKKIVGFGNESLLKLCEKDWDWNLISERKDLRFTDKIDDKSLIEILLNKPLNWDIVSKRADISFTEDIISLLKDKPLNWKFVSRNETFVPNSKTLSFLKGKTLDWNAISKNENITSDIFEDYKEKINWDELTRNKKFDISNIELLHQYQNRLDWSYLSSSEKFRLSMENLKQFKDRLKWGNINERKDLIVSEELLNSFADVLDWKRVSESMDINLTEELIEKYRNYWDWQLLRENNQVIERLETTLKRYKAEFNCIDFIERFDCQPFIFHFTHLFNAIDIIKSRKILSRNKAEGKFSNAAGNLVARRDTAHNFARFYYRPQTPTQFYNECLGWDNHLFTDYGKSYYNQAYRLGLPKCPMPIFFKFDLKEVLMKITNCCYYSTGNMQTDRAKVIKISDDPSLLQTDHLFYNMSDAFDLAGGNKNYNRETHISILEKIKEYSQQEFLVAEEFDFSSLNSFEIICYDEEQAHILKSQLRDDPICEKITTNNNGIYHMNNRKLSIQESESEISISSDYKDSSYLSIKGEGLKDIQILNPNDIQKETSKEIIAYPTIKFIKTEKPIEVSFVDTSIGKREWTIYKI